MLNHNASLGILSSHDREHQSKNFRIVAYRPEQRLHGIRTMLPLQRHWRKLVYYPDTLCRFVLLHLG